MKWHWSYETLPELAGLPDAEKRRVWDLARRRAQWKAAAWVPLVAAAAVLFVTLQFGVLPALRVASPVPMWVAGPVVGWAVGYGLMRVAM